MSVRNVSGFFSSKNSMVVASSSGRNDIYVEDNDSNNNENDNTNNDRADDKDIASNSTRNNWHRNTLDHNIQTLLSCKPGRGTETKVSDDDKRNGNTNENNNPTKKEILSAMQNLRINDSTIARAQQTKNKTELRKLVDDVLISRGNTPEISLISHKDCATILSPFTLRTFLGKGSYGRVWCFFDEKQNTKIAVKITYGTQNAANFHREVTVLRMLQSVKCDGHDLVPRLIDAWSCKADIEQDAATGRWTIERATKFRKNNFLIMDTWENSMDKYCEVFSPTTTPRDITGPSIDPHTKKKEDTSKAHYGIKELWRMFRLSIALGRAGIVHGDNKPDNYLYRNDPITGTSHIVISDFGFSGRAQNDDYYSSEENEDASLFQDDDDEDGQDGYKDNDDKLRQYHARATKANKSGLVAKIGWQRGFDEWKCGAHYGGCRATRGRDCSPQELLDYASALNAAQLEAYLCFHSGYILSHQDVAYRFVGVTGLPRHPEVSCANYNEALILALRRAFRDVPTVSFNWDDLMDNKKQEPVAVIVKPTNSETKTMAQTNNENNQDSRILVVYHDAAGLDQTRSAITVSMSMSAEERNKKTLKSKLIVPLNKEQQQFAISYITLSQILLYSKYSVEDLPNDFPVNLLYGMSYHYILFWDIPARAILEPFSTIPTHNLLATLQDHTVIGGCVASAQYSRYLNEKVDDELLRSETFAILQEYGLQVKKAEIGNVPWSFLPGIDEPYWILLRI